MILLPSQSVDALNHFAICEDAEEVEYEHNPLTLASPATLVDALSSSPSAIVATCPVL